MATLKKRIENLVSQAKIDQAIKLLLEIDIIEEGNRKELLVLKSRFEKLKSDDEIKGLINRENGTIEKNKITNGLLNFIEKIPEESILLEYKFLLISKKLDIKPSEAQKVYNHLEKRYSERLRQKIDHRLALSLKLNYTQEGTTESYVETFFEGDAKTNTEISHNCLNVLKSHRHILIIGAPGAGKTTLILDLALKWLNQNEEIKIPIILNLASWNKESLSFRDWVCGALVSGYRFSKDFASKIIEEDIALFIFDGLDEVGQSGLTRKEQREIRSNCLICLDKFISEENIEHFIICSRKNEYSELDQNAPIRAEILINPLSREQIEKELYSVSEKKLINKDLNVIRKLKRIIHENNNEIINVICIPFYFNLAFDAKILAQASIPLSQIPRSEREIKNYFLKEFIETKIDKGMGKFNNKEQTIEYLSWLAKWLNNRESVTFELSDFQPSDIENKNRIIKIAGSGYGFILGFSLTFLGIFINIFFGYDFFLGLILSLIGGVIGGSSGFLLGFLVISIMTKWIKADKIQTEDIRHLRLNNLTSLSKWKKIIIRSSERIPLFALSGLFVGGLSILLAKLWIIGFGSNLSFSLFNFDRDINLLWNITKGMIGGAIAGVLINWISELIKHTVNAFSYISYYENIDTPYTRLKNGLSIKIFQIFVFFSIWIIMLAYLNMNFKEESWGFIFMWLSFTPSILYDAPLVKHIVLRIAFFREKKMPLLYVDFLNQLTKVRILEKDGGQWRFRHQIFQDYFANFYEH